MFITLQCFKAKLQNYFIVYLSDDDLQVAIAAKSPLFSILNLCIIPAMKTAAKPECYSL